jgi:hypothetical protein
MPSKPTASHGVQRCPGTLCGRPFQVNRFHAGLSTRTTPGQMTCPHCGLLIRGASDSIFLAHALLPSDEVAFMAGSTTEAGASQED